jgi:hypothetical protein
MEKFAAFIGGALIIFLMVVLMALLFAIITQWAWAGSVGQIFHLPDLTFFQAFWLNVFGGMVFKGSSASSK